VSHQATFKWFGDRGRPWETRLPVPTPNTAENFDRLYAHAQAKFHTNHDITMVQVFMPDEDGYEWFPPERPLTGHLRLGRRIPPQTAPPGARPWFYTILSNVGRHVFRSYVSLMKLDPNKVYFTYEPSGEILMLNSYRKVQPLVRLDEAAALKYLDRASGEAGTTDLLEAAVKAALERGDTYYLKEAR
jgi:hypothetical protein